MECMYTKLALYGSKNECARTDYVFSPISQVCDGLISLLRITTINLRQIKSHMWGIQSFFLSAKKKKKEIYKVWRVRGHMSGVKCQVSHVKCRLSGVGCHMYITPTATATDPRTQKNCFAIDQYDFQHLYMGVIRSFNVAKSGTQDTKTSQLRDWIDPVGQYSENNLIGFHGILA